MNKIYTVLAIFMLVSVAGFAQLPVILFEDFNAPFDTLPGEEDGVSPFALGDDTTWVNFDRDGLADANGRPQGWYHDPTGWYAQDSAQLGVLLSSSWLSGYADGNRNWLILPPIYLDANGNDSASISWKSAPFQGPRYMDGYSVRVSITNNDPLASPYPFTDTLFQHCQMVPPLGTGFDVTTFNYDPLPIFQGGTGYIHASDYTDTNYSFIDTLAGDTAFDGLLEPHTLNLSQYAGMRIYIAFVHDSDDDNLMALDDIMVEANGAVGVLVSNRNVVLDAELNVFPNPARDFLNLNYTVHQKGDVNAYILDVTGRVVIEQNGLSADAGTYTERINVADLPAGTYQLVLIQKGERIAKPFIKQ